MRRPKSTVVLAVAVAALCLHTAAAQATGTQPSDTATGARSPAGLIAFVDSALRLAVLDPSSLEVTALGRPGERAVFPAWSSDGNKVAAIIAGSSGIRVDIVDVAAGTEPQTVYQRSQRGPIYLYFSPDDRYLSLLVNAPGGNLELELVALSATDVAASNVTTFASGQPFYWVWLRTARSVMVHRDVLRPGAQVGISRLESFDIASELPAPGAFQSPDVSDSQRYLAYARRAEGGGGELVVVNNPDRGEPRAVAQVPHLGIVAFAWRPGAEQLAIQGAIESGSFFGQLELLDVETGAITLLSSDQVAASFWSPDGRWIAALSTTPSRERFAHDGDLQLVQASPTSLYLRLIEVDTLRSVDLGSFTPSNAFAAQYLPFFDQYSRSHSLWSPDSRAIVLPTAASPATGSGAGSSLLVAYTIDGEKLELVAGDMPAWNVR